MSAKVSFTAMERGTQADYDLIEAFHDPYYETKPLEHFEPIVRALFAKEPRPFF